MTQSSLRPALAALLFLSACESAAIAPSDAGTDAVVGDAGPPRAITIGPEARPATVVMPAAYDGTTQLPVVFLLHGYSVNAAVQDTYFGASRVARSMGFYLVLPEGTEDASGKQFWNATPGCCDFGRTGVDDVAYLTGLLDELEERVPVDTTRVYFTGHSNGGFMSYRMACELAPRIAGIAVLAGSDFAGEMDCVPSMPVSVLHVHGTDDASVPYENGGSYPGARDTVLRWAGRASCDTTMVETLEPIDLVSTLEGAETRRERWATGCATGTSAELWTIVDGNHQPPFDRDAYADMIGWLFTRHR